MFSFLLFFFFPFFSLLAKCRSSTSLFLKGGLEGEMYWNARADFPLFFTFPSFFLFYLFLFTQYVFEQCFLVLRKKACIDQFSSFPSLFPFSDLRARRKNEEEKKFDFVTSYSPLFPSFPFSFSHPLNKLGRRLLGCRHSGIPFFSPVATNDGRRRFHHHESLFSLFLFLSSPQFEPFPFSIFDDHKRWNPFLTSARD